MIITLLEAELLGSENRHELFVLCELGEKKTRITVPLIDRRCFDQCFCCFAVFSVQCCTQSVHIFVLALGNFWGVVDHYSFQFNQ